MESHYLYSKDIYRLEKTHSHFRLFDWHKENSVFLGHFLNSLKRVKAGFVFNRLALECFSRFIHSPAWPKKSLPIFVPAPSSIPGKPDHALEFAKALSFYFGGKIGPLLKRTVLSAQKRKNRFYRSQIRFDLIDNTMNDLIHSSQNKTFIFIDDILTTGWTARKAFKALGSPRNFIICTLTWRRLLNQKKESSLLYEQKKYNEIIDKKILFLKRFLHKN